MKDKIDFILFFVTLFAGVLLIENLPDGKDKYWLIPFCIYLIIRDYRGKGKKPLKTVLD
ncbi:hypothetical protein [Mesobacillus zeae]|uniref:hypothetical protein n=1 Tax=Mesobacillus zeae TaxID=1917180 RepID=UPI00300AA483